jgi:nucleoside-diphosphate kinase
MTLEQTFIMVKPDGFQKGLCGEIISRLTKRGFTLRAAKLMRITPDLAKRHYAEHVDKAFYPELELFITSAPALVMVWEGAHVVRIVRAMMGPTDGSLAPSGSIRGDYSTSNSQNIIHGSDSVDSAKREIALFFTAHELV